LAPQHKGILKHKGAGWHFFLLYSQS